MNRKLIDTHRVGTGGNGGHPTKYSVYKGKKKIYYFAMTPEHPADEIIYEDVDVDNAFTICARLNGKKINSERV